MTKMKRKFTSPSKYFGQVRDTRILAEGRTKREAVKRLRIAFSNQGIQTIPDGQTDLLTVHHAVRTHTGEYIPAHNTHHQPRQYRGRRERREKVRPQPEVI